MNHFIVIIFSILALLPLQSDAQIDTSMMTEEIDEVFVTATLVQTRTADVSSPVATITKKEIKEIGSQRLSDVLQEQTGVVLVRDHGVGLQLQGLDSDYTLILVDGVPLIGRTAGTFDLSRLSTANVSKIEILKGPSSSLYGSEALAGVVNIITESPDRSSAQVSARYATYNTVDLTAQASTKTGKTALSAMINRNSSSGFDHDKTTLSKTVSPYHSYTSQLRAIYTATDRLSADVNLRYYREEQDILFETKSNDVSDRVSGASIQSDYNIAPSISYWLTNDWKLQLYYYHTRYHVDTKMTFESTGASFDQSYFTQYFNRPELRSTLSLSSDNTLVLGVGNTYESVESTRYTDIHDYQAPYIYGQYAMAITPKWRMTVGGRYDAHSVYGQQFSPKLSTLYKVSDKISIKGSIGRGFKAPDFRQLYLSFTNPVAGYSVFGTEEVSDQIKMLSDAGQIAALYVQPSEITQVAPESSWAINVGATAQPLPYLSAELNLFRNDLSNLIETQAIALKTNGQNVFSYLNIESVFTQGAEFNIRTYLSREIAVKVGYQYLEAKNKAVLDKIDNGELFKRDPQTLVTSRLQRSDYGGLMNRSKHTLNLKLSYKNKQNWLATMRLLYRSKYGLYDTNGNLILDAPEEYISGRLMLNTSIGKHITPDLSLLLGANNLLNQKEQKIPTITGRQLWAKIDYHLK